MVRYMDWLFYTELAKALGALLFWHFDINGDYTPFLMPVPDIKPLLQ